MQSTRILSLMGLSFTLIFATFAPATTPVLEFGGDDSYVDLGSPAALQIANNAPFTVEGWMYLKSFSTRDMLFSKSATRPTAGPYTYMFGFRDGDLAAYDGGSWQGDFDISRETARWYHLAFSFDGSEMRYYVDGVLVGETAFSFSNTESDQITIGGYNDSSDIEGYKSDVRLWDHARSAGEIDFYRTVRLTGAEFGLLGYWPLSEVEGGQVFDFTPNASTGTVVYASLTTVENLSLSPAVPSGVLPAPAFSLADLETGSTRFTNSNEVEIVGLSVPDGYTHFQIGDDGDPAALGGWQPIDAIPVNYEFTQPAADADITLYAWFTNTADSVTLRRSEGRTIYTTTLPQPVAHPSLTRETAGFAVRIDGADLDAGSTGGTAGGESMEIHALEALWDGGPHPDATPDDPFVTLTNAGIYTVKLRVVNEAGNASLSSEVCTVTLQNAVNPPSDGDRFVALGNHFAAHPYDTWTNAAGSIQTAINATTANGETVLVWPGRYTAPTNAITGDGAVNVVSLPRPLTLRSAGSAKNTLIDGEGVNRGIRVRYSSSTLFVLDGFTVTNGIAPDGGAIYLAIESGSIPGEILNSTFVDNRASGSGGAISSSRGGGGASRGTMVISNCVFRANRTLATGGGGAIVITSNSDLCSIYDTVFEENSAISASQGGGAIRLSHASMLIENSIFRNNQGPTGTGATTGGGVLQMHPSVTATFRNCLLVGNTAGNGGVAHLGENTSNVMNFENCTVADNPRAIYMDNRPDKLPKLNLWNTILYHNPGYNIVLRNTNPGGLVNIHHSCTPFTTYDADFNDRNNVTAPPKLVDRAAGNYRLAADSPCINAGMELGWHEGAVDLDNKSRVDGLFNQVDIGAYEYRFAGTVIFVR